MKRQIYIIYLRPTLIVDYDQFLQIFYRKRFHFDKL